MSTSKKVFRITLEDIERLVHIARVVEPESVLVKDSPKSEARYRSLMYRIRAEVGKENLDIIVTDSPNLRLQT